MADLDKLLTLPGALAAFEYSDRGELTAHKAASGSNLDEKILDLASHVCVANLSIATMQARGWEGVTGMKGFYPIEGFTMVGVDWTTVCSGGSGIVMENSKADIQAAYNALEQ
ncbi:MAG: DUF2173 family protein [Gammaproteobacteria bacterium]|jgi:roadblock/LC7 domain-containing protein